MATKTENADIAVLKEQMRGVKGDMLEVKADVKTILDRLDNSYVKKEEFKAFKWTTIPITILVSVALTFLVTFFLQNISKEQKANNQASSTKSTETTTNNTTTTTPATTGNDGSSSTSGGVQIELPKVTP